MSVAIQYGILSNTRVVLQDTVFTDLPEDSNGSNVVLRKEPAVTDQDTLPIIIVCPAALGETEKPLGFQTRDVVYHVNIVIVAKNNLDFEAGLGDYLEWREQIRNLLYWTDTLPVTLGIPTLWNTEFFGEAAIDRRKIPQNYDYSAMLIKFHSQEPRP